jgi:hypothetical protein
MPRWLKFLQALFTGAAPVETTATGQFKAEQAFIYYD